MDSLEEELPGFPQFFPQMARDRCLSDFACPLPVKNTSKNYLQGHAVENALLRGGLVVLGWVVPVPGPV